MKKLIATFATLLTISSVFAQAPEKMNYQAVARDLSGIPLVNTAVNLQFDILQGSASGTLSYSETQSKVTNQFGLFTAEIGDGATISGSFPGIAWGANAYFLRITVNGDLMPATQLLSVPYALYSKQSANGPSGLDGLNCWDTNGNGIQDAAEDINGDSSWDALDCQGSGGTYTAGSGIDISGNVITATSDTSLINELQNLSWNTADSNIINISNGSGIDLASNVPTTNDVLTWNGANWTAQTVGGGAFNSNGTETVLNTITDNVGIGTSTPNSKLTVVSPDPSIASFVGSNTVYSALAVSNTPLNPNAGVGIVLLTGSDTGAVGINPIDKQMVVNNSTTGGHLTLSADSSVISYAEVLGQNGQKILEKADTIISFGKTTNNVININQGSYITDSLYVIGNNFFGNTGYVLANDGFGQAVWTDPTTLPSPAGLWQSNTPNISFNTGNVGVGSATPQQLFTLSTLGSTTLRMERSNAAAFDWEMNVDNSGFHLKGGADGTAGALTDFVNVDGFGKVGLGITTPTQLLHLFNGTLRIDNGANPYNLPAADGTVSGQVMTTDAAGNATWQTAGADTDWTENVSFIYNNTKRVVVGSTTTGTGTQMEVETSTRQIGLMIDNNFAGAVQTFGITTDVSNLGTGPKYGYHSYVRGNAAQTNDIIGVFNQVSTANTEIGYGVYNSFAIASGSGARYGVYNENEDYNYFSGEVGIGVIVPTATLDVRGSLFFPNAGTPGANKVLTSDATGNATWQAPAGGLNGIYSGSGSLTGDAIVTQAANRISFNSTIGSGFSINNNVANNTVVNIQNLTDGTPGTPAGSVGSQILVSAANTTKTAVFGAATGTGTGNQTGVWGAAEGVGSGFNRGINAISRNSTNTNIAGDFITSGNTGNSYGLRVTVSGTQTSTKYGLRLITSGGGTKFGVYSQGEDRNYFSGDVGIGTNAPTSKLHINGGHLRHEGIQPAGTVAGSSDMRGAVNVSFVSTGTMMVVFAGGFTVVPTVIITPVCNADPSVNARYWVSNVSTTGFTVNWVNTNSTPSINYMVIE